MTHHFNSKEFRKFCSNNNIECLKSPPYHPQSNGWAECGVRTVKQSLRKMLNETTNTSNMPLLISRFLIKYRNTPVTTTGVTPNDRIFIFRPATLMDALRCRATPSNAVNTEIEKSPEKPTTRPKATTNSASAANTNKKYALNELVLYRNEFKKEIKWLKAKIIKIISKCRYEIELLTRGSRRQCHGDQLRTFNNNEFLKLPVTSNIRRDAFVSLKPHKRTAKLRNIPTKLKRSDRLKGKPRENYYEAVARSVNKRKKRVIRPGGETS